MSLLIVFVSEQLYTLFVFMYMHTIRSLRVYGVARPLFSIDHHLTTGLPCSKKARGF